MLLQSKIITPVSNGDILPFILAVDLGTLSVRVAAIARLLGHHFGMFEFNDVDPLELAERQDAAVATGFPWVD